MAAVTIDTDLATLRQMTRLIRDAVGFALAEKNIPHEPTWTLLVPQHLDDIDSAADRVETELARLREEQDAARTWFEEHFVDEDGEPAGLTLTEMLDHVFKWGDGAWHHAGAAEARCARLQQALAPFVEEYDFHAADYLANDEDARVFTARTVELLIEHQRAAREALAGPDTPADSQEDKT